MDNSKICKIIISLVILGLLLIFAATETPAVPSFKRQTGQDCYACHTVFPELTPIGRAFKLTGYVLNKKGDKCPPYPPLTAMTLFSNTHIDKSQPGLVAPDIWSRHSLTSDNSNDVIGSPQQFTMLYAGQIYDKIGAFIQGSYFNTTTSRGFPMIVDSSDIRYANSTQLCDKDLIFGVTVNNDPSVEDVWNTTPAFSFPYAVSSVAPVPAATPLINTLSSQVGGAGVYFYWNNTIYVLASLYRTAYNGITFPFGAGVTPFAVQVDGGLPYWRIAFTRQFGPHSLEIGTFGLVGDTFVGADRSQPTDHFTDVAVDAQYQYLFDKHSFSLQTTWIHEDQNRSGSFAASAASNTSDTIDSYKITGNYYYRSQNCGTIGGSAGFFSITGDTDPLLYSESANGSPDSRGAILELDYLPPWKWPYTKFSLQYIIYNKFNGGSTNYDGFGHNASDNNTLFFLIWTAF